LGSSSVGAAIFGWLIWLWLRVVVIVWESHECSPYATGPMPRPLYPSQILL
jgi:hypothetical protein